MSCLETAQAGRTADAAAPQMTRLRQGGARISEGSDFVTMPGDCPDTNLLGAIALIDVNAYGYPISGRHARLDRWEPTMQV